MYFNNTINNRNNNKTYEELCLLINNELNQLLNKDQLKLQIKQNLIFQNFIESNITFIPTFKYDKNSNSLDTSKKARVPAWTDRILFAIYNNTENNHINDESFDETRNNKNSKKSVTTELIPLEYNCLDCRHSDHRPVYAMFQLNLTN